MQQPINLEQLAKRLGKATHHNNGWVCLCPAHNDTDPSLSLSWDPYTQKPLVFCHAGCFFKDVMGALRQKGVDKFLPSNHREIPIASKQEAVKRIWRQTHPADGSLVECYLEERGYIGKVPHSIRYHSDLYHYTTRRNYPCMIARVNMWPHNNLLGIHRTYLSMDGLSKANIQSNKMMLGRMKGGAVQLTPPGPKLVIAEGIETALSVYQSTQIPTWAALSTTGMCHVIVPPLDITQQIIIAADGDKAGRKAAHTLAKRLAPQGYKIQMAYAPEGMDFNDVLKRVE